MGSPKTGTVINQPTSLMGAIYDPDNNLVYYSVTVTPMGEEGLGEPIVLDDLRAADGETLSNVGSSAEDVEIAVLDATALADGNYRLDITAEDQAGNQTLIARSFTVDSDVKLGNFSLSFNDLSVPVLGLPLTVQRTYDTLDAQEQGDFGYGWNLDIFSGSLSDNSEANPYTDAGLWGGMGYEPAYWNGTHVTVTLPTGEELGFTAVARTIDTGGYGSFAGSLLTYSADLYIMAFLPDPGQSQGYLDLQTGSQFHVDDFPAPFDTVESLELYVDPDTGEFRSPTTGGGVPYNPADSTYNDDFRLRMADGSEYSFDSATGDLLSYTDRNGNRLEPGENELITYDTTGAELRSSDHPAQRRGAEPHRIDHRPRWRAGRLWLRRHRQPDQLHQPHRSRDHLRLRRGSLQRARHRSRRAHPHLHHR